jgi:hypothetical protein
MRTPVVREIPDLAARSAVTAAFPDPLTVIVEEAKARAAVVRD